MKPARSYGSIFLALVILISTLIFGVTSCERKSRQRAELNQMAREAFLFGYPLVLNEVRNRYTDLIMKTSKKETHVPAYKFFHSRKVRDATLKDMASLDSDMIYSSAWVQLSKDPVVIHVPDSGGRYYVAGLVGGWSDIVGVIGSRTTGNKTQNFLLAGPQWAGETPAGMTLIKSPTNLVWIPFRINASDMKATLSARDFQTGLRLTPLSQWQKPKTQVLREVDPQLNPNIEPRDYVFTMNAEEYYRTLTGLMVDNPAFLHDAPMVDKMHRLGLMPTRSFEFSKLSSETQAALHESMRNARSFVLNQQGSFAPKGRLVNGWVVSSNNISFGTDYLRRAFEAYQGLGLLPPQDALFPVAYEDEIGQQLMGENSYKLTFPKDQLPPVNAFWSATLYRLPQVAFSGSKIQKYSLGSYNNLKTNQDGSITLYIQPTSPGKSLESNWLPSAPGIYQLTLKMYWPKKEVLEGGWFPPVIERVRQSRLVMVSQ